MNNKKTIKRVISFIGNYWYLLLISLVFGIISVAMTLYIPLRIGNAIDLIRGINEVDLVGIKNIFTGLLFLEISDSEL